VPAHDRQRVQQAAVLGRRPDVHQVEQPKQQAPVLGVGRPEQRQVVAAVPGRHRPALLRQRFDAAPRRQEFPHLAPECGVARQRAFRRDGGLLVLRRLQHLPEDADQGFLNLTLLFVERVEPLLGRGLGPPDAAQQHLDQLVAATHAGLAQQGEQQGVPLARPGDVEEVGDLQRRGLGGELEQLGVGDALQRRGWGD